MTNGYAIRPETVRQAAKELTAAGDRLAQEWQSLVGTVEGMGAPWGNDDIGMLIGESYLAIQETANESFTGAADDLRAFGEKLTLVADNHEKAEQEMVGNINSISAALNG
ncbi:hypothetical protein Arub01_35130 [Actinomadura rubrobrunea]|uniref:PE domain-containing protein n=1 Tax=Actinomadura rubrobrunea TaxID=115335 RepID=A0A9W6UVN9_9ACTN|nr:PE domain-containing protein [Actinomadura rubrobrunea]GLW65269.1 hypothetical protein Arub01_35130 [Actinomadura rubrobrunea]